MHESSISIIDIYGYLFLTSCKVITMNIFLSILNLLIYGDAEFITNDTLKSFRL
jgi:hypothetical protein